MLEVDDGIYLSPEHVTMIKSAGEGKCALWVTGQSALDGFVLDRDAKELAEDISNSLGVGLESVFSSNEDNDETEGDEDEEE